MSDMFGSTESEEKLQKVLTCREIVKTITQYGVSQEQILLIIQFLGYELENHDQMLEVVGLTKELLGGSAPLLITKTEG